MQAHFDQAAPVASALNLLLRSKPRPVCGFPIDQLARHLKQLVHLNQRKVAVYRERPHPGDSKLVERYLSRIYTPGTLFEADLVDPARSSVLYAIVPVSTASANPLYNVAHIDVSEGNLHSQSHVHGALADHIDVVHPIEIVLPQSMRSSVPPALQHILDGVSAVVSFSDSEPNLKRQPLPAAERLLRRYIADTTLESHGNLPIRSKSAASPTPEMSLDVTALTALNLRTTETDGAISAKGSLYTSIRRTVTVGGNRLLLRRLGMSYCRAHSIG